jgi:hypothetical protein
MSTINELFSITVHRFSELFTGIVLVNDLLMIRKPVRWCKQTPSTWRTLRISSWMLTQLCHNLTIIDRLGNSAYRPVHKVYAVSVEKWDTLIYIHRLALNSTVFEVFVKLRDGNYVSRTLQANRRLYYSQEVCKACKNLGEKDYAVKWVMICSRTGSNDWKISAVDAFLNIPGRNFHPSQHLKHSLLDKKFLPKSICPSFTFYCIPFLCVI